MKKIIPVVIVVLFALNSCTPVNPVSLSETQGNTTPLAETAVVTPALNRPFPQHKQYAEGSILPNQRSQDQLDDDVRDFYDYWKAAYVVSAGADDDGYPLYRIAFGKEDEDFDQTVSEGQGFGMTIVPVMAGYDPEAQAIFDGLWRFARAHPSEVDPRLMDWKVPESIDGDDSAFDGDADMALGLLMADAQWGSAGTIDYKSEAITLITAIRESTLGTESHLPLLGDWVGEGNADYNQYTPRSSDFMLVNFRAFAAATGDDTWNQAVTASQAVMWSLQSNFSPNTGLLPDFIVMTSEAHTPEPAYVGFLEGLNDGHYSYNAGRDPWRVGADALQSGDAVSKEIAGRISLWAETVTGGDPTAFRAGYDLEGNPLPNSDYFTTFFVAPLGVAAMSNPDQQEWLNAVYDAVYNTHEDYYEDSVTLLCLIVMSGNAWAP